MCRMPACAGLYRLATCNKKDLSAQEVSGWGFHVGLTFVVRGGCIAGKVFGELALIGDSRRKGRASASKRTQVLVLGKEDRALVQRASGA
eukprot:249388-Amphidinium_carterae.1